MKTLIILAALFTAAGPVQAQNAKPQQLVRLGCLFEVSGKVELREAGKTAWQPAPKGQPVAQGDTIKTAAGAWCEVLLKEGSFVKIDENSEVTAEKLAVEAGKREFSFSFLRGKALWMVKKLGKKTASVFAVRTPAAVCAVRGTDFSMLVEPSGETKLGLFEGEVALSGTSGEKLLKAGGEATAAADKIETADRLSGLMKGEQRRYNRLKKRVEDLRRRLAAREDFIDDYVNRQQKALADFEARRQEKLKKR
jgi:hypothetical protein